MSQLNANNSSTSKFQNRMKEKNNNKLTEKERNKYNLIMSAIKMQDEAQQLDNNEEYEEARKLKQKSNEILDGFDEKEVLEYQKSYYEDKELRIRKRMEEQEKQQSIINEENRIFREKQNQEQKIIDDKKQEKEKYLNKYLNTFDSVLQKGKQRTTLQNRHEKLEELNKSVVKLEAGKKSAVEYNRVKFNRMDSQQQAQYERRMNETKPQYRAYISDNSFREVSKTEFEYLTFLQSEKNKVWHLSK